MIVLFWFMLGVMTVLALLFLVVPLCKMKYTLLPVMVLFPMMACIFYLHWGASQKLIHYWALQRQAEKVKQDLAQYKDPQQVIAQLQAHLKDSPDSARGWYLLGRIYLTMQQYAKATLALEKAWHLNPNDRTIATTYAQALFFDHHRKLSSKAVALLQNVIKRFPNDIDAINLLAVNAYNVGDYQTAVNYWEKLLPLFPPASEDSQALLTMIARAEKQLNKKKD